MSNRSVSAAKACPFSFGKADPQICSYFQPSPQSVTPQLAMRSLLVKRGLIALDARPELKNEDSSLNLYRRQPMNTERTKGSRPGFISSGKSFYRNAKKDAGKVMRSDLVKVVTGKEVKLNEGQSKAQALLSSLMRAPEQSHLGKQAASGVKVVASEVAGLGSGIKRWANGRPRQYNYPTPSAPKVPQSGPSHYNHDSSLDDYRYFPTSHHYQPHSGEYYQPHPPSQPQAYPLPRHTERSGPRSAHQPSSADVHQTVPAQFTPLSDFAKSFYESNPLQSPHRENIQHHPSDAETHLPHERKAGESATDTEFAKSFYEVGRLHRSQSRNDFHDSRYAADGQSSGSVFFGSPSHLDLNQDANPWGWDDSNSANRPRV